MYIARPKPALLTSWKFFIRMIASSLTNKGSRICMWRGA